ncbi:hypothetical protein DIPPA_01022 [Diplonema papillatum]|nr:hypothetical protein DIPPA_01022 [Diplonema papillatum]|eukprot:gene19226-29610_t
MWATNADSTAAAFRFETPLKKSSTLSSASSAASTASFGSSSPMSSARHADTSLSSSMSSSPARTGRDEPLLNSKSNVYATHTATPTKGSASRAKHGQAKPSGGKATPIILPAPQAQAGRLNAPQNAASAGFGANRTMTSVVPNVNSNLKFPGHAPAVQLPLMAMLPQMPQVGLNGFAGVNMNMNMNMNMNLMNMNANMAMNQPALGFNAAAGMMMFPQMNQSLAQYWQYQLAAQTQAAQMNQQQSPQEESDSDDDSEEDIQNLVEEARKEYRQAHEPAAGVELASPDCASSPKTLTLAEGPSGGDSAMAYYQKVMLDESDSESDAESETDSDTDDERMLVTTLTGLTGYTDPQPQTQHVTFATPGPASHDSDDDLTSPAEYSLNHLLNSLTEFSTEDEAPLLTDSFAFRF